MRALLILLAGLVLGGAPLAGAAEPGPLPAPPPGSLAAPPPMPAGTPMTPSAPSTRPAGDAVDVPRPKIESGSATGSAPGELGEPSAQEQLPPAHPTAPETRIEQIRQGNRVAEIRVTPAGSSHSYVIVAREPSRQQSLQDSGTGLSTPRFLRLEF